MKAGIKVWSVAVALVMALAFSGTAQSKVRAPRHHNQQEQGQNQPAQQQQQPKEIKTAYFTLALEDGWRLLKPVQSRNGAVSVILGAPNNKGAIAINVMKANLPAAEIAKNMRANMQKDKATVEEPVEKDGFQEFAFKRDKATGRAWVGANGKEAAVVTIFGDQEAGKAQMQKLESKDAKLFPKF